MNGRDNRGRRKSFRNRNPERLDRSGHARDGKTRDEFYQRKYGEKSGNGIKNDLEPAAETREGRGSPLEGKSGWTASEQNAVPLSAFKCIHCGLPITDSYSALSDRKTGEPVHFDCVMLELSKQEKLETGDSLSYIGGGRFGIVHFNDGRGDTRNFSIKKILEWEDKEKRAEWRDAIADRYTIT